MQAGANASIARAAALGFAVSVVLVKALTRTETAVAIRFWMLVQSAIGLVPAVLVSQRPSPAAWSWVTAVPLCGTHSREHGLAAGRREVVADRGGDQPGPADVAPAQ